MMTLKLRMLDVSGVEVRHAVSSIDHSVTALGLSANPWDPAKGLLTVSDGNWQLGIDGDYGSGGWLSDGLYNIEVSAGTVTLSIQVLLLRKSINRTRPRAYPNPVGAGIASMSIDWKAGMPAEVRIYDESGALVRSYPADTLPTLVWDLRTQSGKSAANGIYLIVIRALGERRGHTVKVALAR